MVMSYSHGILPFAWAYTRYRAHLKKFLIGVINEPKKMKPAL